MKSIGEALLGHGYYIRTVGRIGEEKRPKRARELILSSMGELRGKGLACWCKEDEPCHADVLLEIANQEMENE